MAKFSLDPFDMARDFVVARDQILWRGEVLVRGQEFPKRTASKRSLRLLYETRAIAYADGASNAPSQPASPPPPPVKRPDEIKLALVQDHTAKQLIGILTDLGQTPARGANKTQLADQIMQARNVAARR